MKKTIICLIIVVSLFSSSYNINTVIGEEVCSVGFIDSLLNSFKIPGFLEKRGILAEDREVYNYAVTFLNLALVEDIEAMKEMFAQNAISEIGEDQLNEMLEKFIDYFQADSFELVIPVGPVTSEHRDQEKKSKILEGPLEVITDKMEYRLAMKCVAYDDWDENNVGIWSIYIIEKSKDTDLEHPYIGDKKYRTGIYIDMKRSN